MSFGLAGISTYTDLLFEYESFDEILNATMFSESFFLMTCYYIISSLKTMLLSSLCSQIFKVTDVLNKSYIEFILNLYNGSLVGRLLMNSGGKCTYVLLF